MPALSAHGFARLARSHAENSLRRSLRIAAIVGVSIVLALGVLLTARRLAGALVAVLPAPQLLIAATIAAMAVWASRQAWRHAAATPATPTDRRLEQFIGWGGSMALVLVCLGCSYPGAQLSHWLIGAPILAGDQFLRHAFFTAARPAPPRAKTDSDAGADLDDAPEQVVQQLTRLRDAAGSEIVRGTLRADFVAGQRHATLHVGFCPPLAALPEIAAEPVAGPDATIKIVQAFAHGARLDLRLEEPADEPCHVLIELSATPVDPPSPLP